MTDVDRGRLKEELSRAIPFINQNAEEWKRVDTGKKKKITPAIERWKQVFDNVSDLPNLEILVSFLFALPGSNATCERIFSEIKYIWTNCKSRIKLETVDAILKIRYNLTNLCEVMFSMLISDEKLKAAVSCSDKYEDAKFKVANDKDEETDYEEDDDNVDNEESEESDEESDEDKEKIDQSDQSSEEDGEPNQSSSVQSVSKNIQISERLLRGLELADHKRPSLGTPSPKKVDKKKQKVESRLRKSLNFEVTK